MREHREAAGLTLTEFAKAIGKTKGMVSQVENRQSAASSKTLEDIADFFGLPQGICSNRRCRKAGAASPRSFPKIINSAAVHSVDSGDVR